MRDAFGGLMNLVLIVLFIVLVSGYLAFNVNYTKAFRVKNKIISTFEQYEGNCENDSSPCRMAIKDYKNALGYKAPNLSIDGYTCPSKEGFCYKKIDANVNDPGSPNDRGKRYYYKIVTQISIDIPIINNIMPGLKIFQVTGDTKVIEQIK